MSENTPSIISEFKESMLNQGYTEYCADFFCNTLGQVLSLVSELNKVSNVEFVVNIK